MSATSTVATVRFGRLERRGVLLGRSGPQLAVLGAAASIAIVAEYSGGLAGLIAALPAWAPLALFGSASLHGRSALAWIPVVGDWILRRLAGATRWRQRPATSMEGLSIAVPGARRPLPVICTPDGAALIEDRAAGTITAVLAVRGREFLLADPGHQAAAATGWGQLLASLTRSRDIARIQVLHATAPAVDGEVRRWWADHATGTATPLPARLVADLLADADHTASRVTCLIAVAFDRRALPDPSAAVLAAFADAAQAAGLAVTGWLTPRQLARTVRRAYDPTTPAPDSSRIADEGRDAIPVGAGAAMAIDESWSHLRTDTAFHASYWIAEWPRADAAMDFLQPLLLAAGAQRTVSLIAEPVALHTAARDIRRARVDLAADSALRARAGRIEDESTRAEADDVARRERDLVAGHGDLRFTGLITVTAPDLDGLQEARRATEAAAARAMCELRPLSGQQAAAHTAAALPLARGIL